MTYYVIIGAAISCWLASSNKEGSFGPLEALLVMAIWPAILGGLATGLK